MLHLARIQSPAYFLSVRWTEYPQLYTVSRATTVVTWAFRGRHTHRGGSCRCGDTCYCGGTHHCGYTYHKTLISPPIVVGTTGSGTTTGGGSRHGCQGVTPAAKCSQVGQPPRKRRPPEPRVTHTRGGHDHTWTLQPHVDTRTTGKLPRQQNCREHTPAQEQRARILLADDPTWPGSALV